LDSSKVEDAAGGRGVVVLKSKSAIVISLMTIADFHLRIYVSDG